MKKLVWRYSVKLELTGCIASLSVGEIKVYKGPHCHDAEDGCGELFYVLHLLYHTVKLYTPIYDQHPRP